MNGLVIRPNSERLKYIMVPIILLEVGMLLFIATILKEGLLSSSNFLVFFLSTTVIVISVLLVKPIMKIFDSKIIIDTNEIMFDVVKRNTVDIYDIEKVSVVVMKSTGQKIYTKLIFTVSKNKSTLKNLFSFKKQKIEIVEDIFDKRDIMLLIDEIQKRNPSVIIDEEVYKNQFDLLNTKRQQIIFTLAPVFCISSLITLLL